VPGTPGRQVVSPQVARKAVDILTGDTKYPGTSADAFASWYAAHPGSPISGKTGTAPGVSAHTHKADKNGALWFVGMTPNYVGTNALINLDNPSSPASGLPGIHDAADTAFGGVAAKFWIAAMRSTLSSGGGWTWPSPDTVNGDPVPSVIGLSAQDARKQLKRDGYRMVLLGGPAGIECDNTQHLPVGEIAYYGPTIAPRGATITVCPSSGVRQDLWVYVPPPPPVHHPSPNPSPGGGNGSGTPGGGGNTGGGGGGGGGGGTPAPPGGGHSPPPPGGGHSPPPPGGGHGGH
jgi:membrane peptidoglycan carboxypeptidase